MECQVFPTLQRLHCFSSLRQRFASVVQSALQITWKKFSQIQLEYALLTAVQSIWSFFEISKVGVLPTFSCYVVINKPLKQFHSLLQSAYKEQSVLAENIYIVSWKCNIEHNVYTIIFSVIKCKFIWLAWNWLHFSTVSVFCIVGLLHASRCVWATRRFYYVARN